MSPSAARRPAAPRPAAVAVVVLATVAVLGLVVLSSAPGGAAPATPGPTSAAGSGPPDSSLAADATATPTASLLPTASPTPSPTGTPSPSTASASPSPGPLVEHGYLVTLAELRERARLAKAGLQPEKAAVADLRAWARGAFRRHPRPANPLQISGTTGPFVDDAAAAYGLALAWGVSGNQRYARASRAFVMTWVRTTRELIGACPDRGDCQTSLIVSRTAPDFVFAMDLLASSGVLTTADGTAFREWLRDVILPAASTRTNNWGDAGVLLRVVATDYLGDAAGFAAAIAAWRSQLDLVAADGHIPEEVRRGPAGLAYTQEALLYKLAVARVAERRGIDLWDARGANGGTLRGALDLLVHYWNHPTRWPWANRISVPDPSPAWELAFAHWYTPAFARILATGRPYGSDGHSAIRWTTLTNGVPLKR